MGTGQDERRNDDVYEGERMIDARKLQYYTMAHRLRGYCEALEEDKYEALVHTLMKAAMLLEEAWDDYQQTLPPDQRVGS